MPHRRVQIVMLPEMRLGTAPHSPRCWLYTKGLVIRVREPRWADEPGPGQPSYMSVAVLSALVDEEDLAALALVGVTCTPVAG